MTIYFVYRCHHDAPGERRMCRFEADSIVDWMRSIWKPIDDEEQAYKYANELLGGIEVYTFARIFLDIAEENKPPPEDMDGVKSAFESMYLGEMDSGEHHLQILTDDDETEMAIYIFDEHFRQAHPELTDFLVLEGWALPETWSDEDLETVPVNPFEDRPRHPDGTLYTFSLFVEDSCNLSDLCESDIIDGVRVPDLCRYVLTHPDIEQHDYAMQTLREDLQRLLESPTGDDAGFLQAIREEPGELVHWNAYTDWLLEKDLPPAGQHLLELALRTEHLEYARKNRKPEMDCVKVSQHMAQACKHEGSWPDEPFMWFTPNHTYRQWIFFDDRWVAAHPTLAQSILQFSNRWDALTNSPIGRPPQE